jgi:hypothetical protein
VALTVRPDDEVYQFDTVWLGPDEYTLPIQARYVAWGTWLACFLVAAVVLVPIGGDGPGGVLGSLVWALALSVVLSRAVMLVVDHERPLRSLPALFGAEARAALASRGGSERALLVRPTKVRVRPTPAKAQALRERDRARAERKAARRRRPVAAPPAVEPEVAPALPEAGEPLGPDWRAAGPLRPEWTPDSSPAAAGYDDFVEQPEPELTWRVPVDEPHEAPAATGHPSAPVPVVTPLSTADRAGRERGRADESPVTPDGPFRSRPAEAPAHRGRHAAPEDGQTARSDRQASVEARILLPVRKDR